MKKLKKILASTIAVIMFIQLFMVSGMALSGDIVKLEVSGHVIYGTGAMPNVVKGVSFDDTTNTLTLNNATINSGTNRELNTENAGEGKYSDAIYITFDSDYTGDFNIEVLGTNTISHSDQNYSFTAISTSDHNLNIFGDGTLNINVSNAGIANPSTILFSEKDINIEDATINITTKDRTRGYSSSRSAIDADEQITIGGNANVNIDIGDNNKMYGITAPVLVVEDNAFIKTQGSGATEENAFNTQGINVGTIVQKGGTIHSIGGKGKYNETAISSSNVIILGGTLIADSYNDLGEQWTDKAFTSKPTIYGNSVKIYAGTKESQATVTSEDVDYHKNDYVKIEVGVPATTYPDLHLSANEIEYPDLKEGYSNYSLNRRIRFVNLNTKPLLNITSTLTGEDADAFEFTTNEESTLRINEATDIEVNLKEGLTQGTYNAMIIVAGTGFTTKYISVTAKVYTYSQYEKTRVEECLALVQEEHSVYVLDSDGETEKEKAVEKHFDDYFYSVNVSYGSVVVDATPKTADGEYTLTLSSGTYSKQKDTYIIFRSLNEMAIDNAKGEVVDGEIIVASGASQQVKTYEVQKYVEGILAESESYVDGVTAIVAYKSANVYTVTFKNGTKTGTKDITMTEKLRVSEEYLVHYEENGGTGYQQNDIAIENIPFTLPQTTTIVPPTDKVLGYWAIGSVTGPKVEKGKTYVFTENTTVYPIWVDNNVTLTYDPNGGTGSKKTEKVEADSKIYLEDIATIGFNAPSGKVFAGWSLTVSGEIIEEITLTKDTTVYAIWENAENITVKFNGNGATGNMSDIVIKETDKFTLPKNGFNVPSGKEFAGWFIEPESVGEIPGYKVRIISVDDMSELIVGGKTVVFYAVWEDKLPSDEIRVVIKHTETVLYGVEAEMFTTIAKNQVYILPRTEENIIFSTTPDGKNQIAQINSDKDVTIYLAEEPSANLYGDVNVDGKINSFDIIELFRYTAAIKDLSAQGKINADVSGDGTINMFDILTVQRYMASIIEIFPAEK